MKLINRSLIRLLLVTALTAIYPFCMRAETIVDLSGSWRVALDPENIGVQQRWFSRAAEQAISLPGSVQEAGLGEPITTETKWTGGIFDRAYFTAPQYAKYREPGNVKVPFWLQPNTHYTGVAWYQRDVDIPAAWKGKRVVLSLERPHWKTTVWLGEKEIGSSDAMSTPHEYDLGPDVAPGRYRLTVRVDNTVNPDIGENSHSVSDHTQGNWNGIVGRIQWVVTAPVWIADVQVYPVAAERTICVKGRVGRQPSAAAPTKVTLQLNGAAVDAAAALDANGEFNALLKLPRDAALWDEFTPALHTLSVAIDGGENRIVKFGLRDFSADGRQLAINGRRTFLRGTLDCAAFPRTGHPPTDVDTWKKVYGAIKAHGLNHVRFHSWCPPEAAFVAADEMGLYLQIEVATWPNWSTTLGDGKPVDAWIDAETVRIVRAYGNHPSFVMLCAGNEPGGEHYSRWLSGWVDRQKHADTRRVYTAGAGWPELPENQYHVLFQPRIYHWGEGLKSRINALPPETTTDYNDFIRARNTPVVSHEIGQWCVYPNFAEVSKYTGYLKPKNFDIFHDSLEAHGLGAQAHDFLIASGKLQALCYKEEVESALRTPEMAGFQLLGLSDFPGQGTALVGVLDAFWENKGYISAEEFRQFCNSTVPLARLEKRVFTTADHFVAQIDVAHYGASPLKSAPVAWKLTNDRGAPVRQGQLEPRDIAAGKLSELGRIDFPLAELPAPARYQLAVTVRDSATRAEYQNTWDVWVYPRSTEMEITVPTSVHLTSALDEDTRSRLEAGGTVVWNVTPEKVAPDPTRGKIALGFSSIFWNTAWTNGQPPHTLGILCDPRAPALAQFPTDPWSNWQWWYPITHAAPMILDDLPRELSPIVQVVDDWVTNRKLALVFEARVGKGRLLVTSINLSDAALDPVRRQLRASLLAYAASASFQPKVSVPLEQLRKLVAQ